MVEGYIYWKGGILHFTKLEEAKKASLPETAVKTSIDKELYERFEIMVKEWAYVQTMLFGRYTRATTLRDLDSYEARRIMEGFS